MKVDAKDLIQKVKLKGETNRGRVGLYLDKPLYKSFQVICEREQVSASEIIEQFLREFVDTAKEPAKKK